MKTLDTTIKVFDQKYQDSGMRSQRSYPNESLIQFIASNYFSLPLADRKKIRILEVGCGSGANLWMLSKEGFDTYGIDSSQAGIELAAQHLGVKWNVEADMQQASFTSLPYSDAFFDVVVDVVSLQHLNLEDSCVALQEIRRVLRQGGKFFSYRLSDHSVMYEHSAGGWVDAATVDNIADITLPLANNGPITFWSPSLARLMYAKANIAVEEIDRVGRTYSTGSYVEYLAIAGSKA
ncbi:MAG: class I SAM-dependent methyltransferase [Gallionellaceae bacterium]|jgi:SAM-dependent methyltransferase